MLYSEEIRDVDLFRGRTVAAVACVTTDTARAELLSKPFYAVHNIIVRFYQVNQILIKI